jgi:hypothetical protein
MTDTTTTTDSSSPSAVAELTPGATTPTPTNPFRVEPPSGPLSQSVVPQRSPSPVATPPPPVTNAGTGTPNLSEPTPDLSARPLVETQTREAVVEPRVVALRALFPDYDDLILCVHSPLTLARP